MTDGQIFKLNHDTGMDVEHPVEIIAVDGGVGRSFAVDGQVHGDVQVADARRVWCPVIAGQDIGVVTSEGNRIDVGRVAVGLQDGSAQRAVVGRVRAGCG